MDQVTFTQLGILKADTISGCCLKPIDGVALPHIPVRDFLE